MKSKVLRSALVFVLLVGSSCAMPRSSASIVGNTASMKSFADKEKTVLSNSVDGQKLLSQVIESVRAKGAYKYDGYLATDKGREKLSVYTGKFFYKPEGLLRVEVKTGGFKAGSVLVKNKNMIKAKGGPAMFGMRFSLKADSPLLRLPNGINIVESDFLSLLGSLNKLVAQGQKLYASDGPVQISDQKVLVLETHEHGTQVSQRVLISPDDLIPIEWLIFKNGRFLSTVKFSNFQTAGSLDESLFKL